MEAGRGEEGRKLGWRLQIWNGGRELGNGIEAEALQWRHGAEMEGGPGIEAGSWDGGCSAGRLLPGSQLCSCSFLPASCYVKCLIASSSQAGGYAEQAVLVINSPG